MDKLYATTFNPLGVFADVIRDLSAYQKEEFLQKMLDKGRQELLLHLAKKEKLSLPYSIKEALAIKAVKKDDVKLLEEIRNIGFSFTKEKNYLLAIACQSDSINIVKYLVENKASVNSKKYKHLEQAVKNNNVEMVKYLVSQNANVCPTVSDALFLALKNGNMEIIKILLDANADPSKISSNKLSKIRKNKTIWDMIKPIILEKM